MIDVKNSETRALLDESVDEELSFRARELFAGLVLSNRDCQNWFFRLFVASEESLENSSRFRSDATPVTWSFRRDDVGRLAVMRGDLERNIVLRSASEIKGILYGIRYWARDELRLIDEFFRENRGNVMYPLREMRNVEPSQLALEIANCQRSGAEWATIAVGDVIEILGEGKGHSLEAIFRGIKWLAERYADRIVLIPTSPRMATVTAGSAAREEFELRGYYRDASGRYVSHLRIHRSIAEASSNGRL